MHVSRSHGNGTGLLLSARTVVAYKANLTELAGLQSCYGYKIACCEDARCSALAVSLISSQQQTCWTSPDDHALQARR